MKIIKKGCIPNEKTYTVTCDNCKTKFQFQQKEGHITYDQRDGDYISVKCPVCKESVTKSIE